MKPGFSINGEDLSILATSSGSIVLIKDFPFFYFGVFDLPSAGLIALELL
jgi:hypothetical protein